MPLSLQIIVICVTSLAAAFAGSYSGRVFASSRLARRITELETEVATLTSEYSKVLALAKKISNRVALDDHRRTNSKASNRTDDGAPPLGASKAELRDFYLRGKTQKEIAAMHAAGGKLNG